MMWRIALGELAEEEEKDYHPVPNKLDKSPSAGKKDKSSSSPKTTSGEDGSPAIRFGSVWAPTLANSAKPLNLPKQPEPEPATTPSGYEKRETKWLCRLPVGIDADDKENVDFEVVRRIFGPGGSNMKRIAANNGAKLRLRGRGSGFLEGPKNEEPEEPLVLCVSAATARGYNATVRSLKNLFYDIYQDYRSYRKGKGLAPVRLSVQVQEHPANPPVSPTKSWKQ